MDRPVAQRQELVTADQTAEVAELARRLEFAEGLLGVVGVGIISCDATGGTWIRNPESLAVLGMPADGLGPDEAAPLLDVLTPGGDRVPSDAYPLLRALRGEDAAEVELLVGPVGGPHRVIISRNAQIHAADGRLLGAVTALTDVTAERAAQRELHTARQAADRATAFFDAVLAAMPDYVFVVDLAAGTLVYGTDGRSVLGVTTDQFVGMGPAKAADLVHPEDAARLSATNTAARDLKDGQVLQIRFRARHADGTWRWLNRRVTPFRRDDGGTVLEVLGVLRDITEVVGAEDALRHAAVHDQLTGLPNRALLTDRLEASLARAVREQRQVAVLYLDLDSFKSINDSAGHAAGDAVLQHTARRLSAALREHDTVARVGGDEFVVVLEPWHRPDRSAADVDAGQAQDLDVAWHVAHRIQSALRQPIIHEAVTHHIGVSIGIALATPTSRSPGDAGHALTSATKLLHAADGAMYQAKALGTNRVVLA